MKMLKQPKIVLNPTWKNHNVADGPEVAIIRFFTYFPDGTKTPAAAALFQAVLNAKD